jgi:hypothetical protein
MRMKVPEYSVRRSAAARTTCDASSGARQLTGGVLELSVHPHLSNRWEANMRQLRAVQLSLAVFLVACSADPSSPSAPPSSSRAPAAGHQPTYGAVVAIAAARAASDEGFACGLGPAGVTFDSRVTIASSGNATLVCRLRTPAGPKPALIVKGELCAVEGALTPHMHFVWAPSGQATLVCHLKA